ncbi:hypothetical protein Ocin01_00139 [Orchesella cincta]|uniref:Uncharacterized protein n=1 Tax=Orchesella cincta TaxID=48709 RepID=A0A1D2NMS4_ORCCI|nr:hypothetical protein Ocin01_00139 [Orchesella cincta]
MQFFLVLFLFLAAVAVITSAADTTSKVEEEDSYEKFSASHAKPDGEFPFGKRRRRYGK